MDTVMNRIPVPAAGAAAFMDDRVEMVETVASVGA